MPKTVVACAITPEQGGWRKEIVTFSTMTDDLLKLSDWLKGSVSKWRWRVRGSTGDQYLY